MAALACVATLETLDLSECQQIRDVSALSESVSLRELDLSYTNVDNAGIAGLERITSLPSPSPTSPQASWVSKPRLRWNSSSCTIVPGSQMAKGWHAGPRNAPWR
jgi:hypothetical protein